jgi:hypothetical protein
MNLRIIFAGLMLCCFSVVGVVASDAGGQWADGEYFFFCRDIGRSAAPAAACLVVVTVARHEISCKLVPFRCEYLSCKAKGGARSLFRSDVIGMVYSETLDETLDDRLCIVFRNDIDVPELVTTVDNAAWLPSVSFSRVQVVALAASDIHHVADVLRDAASAANGSDCVEIFFRRCARQQRSFIGLPVAVRSADGSAYKDGFGDFNLLYRALHGAYVKERQDDPGARALTSTYLPTLDKYRTRKEREFLFLTMCFDFHPRDALRFLSLIDDSFDGFAAMALMD